MILKARIVRPGILSLFLESLGVSIGLLFPVETSRGYCQGPTKTSHPASPSSILTAPEPRLMQVYDHNWFSCGGAREKG
jgi:hypothetical protein